LETVGDPATVAGINLVGLPGRMRLPADWRSIGKLKDEDLFYLVMEGGFRVEAGDETTEMAVGDLYESDRGPTFIALRTEKCR
jgi:hypothetical protein